MYKIHNVSPMPRFFNNLVTNDGRLGIFWYDEWNAVIHLDYFKPCDTDYHESYTYEDSFISNKNIMFMAAVDIDQETNTIYFYMIQSAKGSGKKDVKGAKIYVMDDKLKKKDETDVNIKDEAYGMDFKAQAK